MTGENTVIIIAEAAVVVTATKIHMVEAIDTSEKVEVVVDSNRSFAFKSYVLEFFIGKNTIHIP